MQYTYLGGKGRPLVCVPGWGSRSHIFTPLQTRLCQRYELWMLDYGAPSALSEPQSWVASMPAALRKTPPLWMGWSLGGTLLLALLEQHPDLVGGALLLASTPCFVQREDWSCAMPETTFAQFEQRLQRQPARTRERFLHLQVMGARDPQLQRYWLEHSGWALSPDAQLQWLQWLRRDQRQQLPGLKVPVAWLLGADDALVPLALADALLSLNSSMRVESVAVGSHLPFLDEPERVVALLDWMERVES